MPFFHLRCRSSGERRALLDAAILADSNSAPLFGLVVLVGVGGGDGVGSDAGASPLDIAALIAS